MDNEIMTVTLESCWSDKSEVREFQRRMKADYGLKAKFYDGGDHYSSWTLTGCKDALKKVINAEWNPSDTDNISLYDAVVIMDESEFEALYGVKAADYR